MSWQAYVDTTLVGSGNVDRGAIYNSEGNSAWASSTGFNVKPDEMRAIVTHFADAADTPAIFGTGFRLAGDKYLTLKADSRSLYGRQGKEGLCICKTKQAILIAHYNESMQPGAAANTTEQLADYLIGLGY